MFVICVQYVYNMCVMVYIKSIYVATLGEKKLHIYAELFNDYVVTSGGLWQLQQIGHTVHTSAVNRTTYEGFFLNST
jgi:uncharacterized membrane protein